MQKTKEDEIVTSINLPKSLALAAKVEAAKRNLSRSRYIVELLIKDIQKIEGAINGIQNRSH